MNYFRKRDIDMYVLFMFKLNIQQSNSLKMLFYRVELHTILPVSVLPEVKEVAGACVCAWLKGESRRVHIGKKVKGVQD